MLLVLDGLTVSLEAALADYEVVDATAEEREVLQWWGHPLSKFREEAGGVS